MSEFVNLRWDGNNLMGDLECDGELLQRGVAVAMFGTTTWSLSADPNGLMSSAYKDALRRVKSRLADARFSKPDGASSP